MQSQKMNMDEGNSAAPSQSEEDITQLVAKTDSFWDIGNYKRVVKRIDDGARLCSDFTKMAQERSEIEAKYVKHLQQWARKWDDLVTKSPEYGSLEVGWKASLKEATKLAEVHLEIQRKILDDIIDSVQTWRSQKYHKSFVNLKETKKAEDNFARAQKPWTKRLEKLRRAKKAFHQASRELDVQTSTLQHAGSNPDIGSEQCGKLRERQDKAQRELDKVVAKYRERLGDLQHYQGRYIEDMTMQFDKCQEFERTRMEFFKETLQKFQQVLDLSQDERLMEVYAEYGETLSRISAEDDLRWYSVHFGADMSYKWPEFEDYIPGQPTLGGKTSTLGRLTHHSTAGGSPAINGTGGRPGRAGHSSTASSSSSSPMLGLDASRNEGYDSADEWPEPPPPEEEDKDSTASKESDSEEEDEEEDSTNKGTLMRALYDYGGSQEDDLNFREGDLVRIMYEGEDGWAEGAMGDKYGYVPIGYFEAV